MPADGVPEPSGDDGYLADWARSRRGAYAARGFHYQDAVGAWLAVQIAAATIEGVLAPEGFDDMSIEAEASVNVQVKSRVLRRGAFSPVEAADHIIDAWVANQRHASPAATIWVVLENGVDSTEEFDNRHKLLRSCLEAGSPLERAIKASAREHRFASVDLNQMLSRTVVIGRTWAQLDDETIADLANLTNDLSRLSRSLISRTLRIEVADATDINANPDYGRRARLDRTAIIAHINSTAEQVDVASLNAALRDGLCTTFDPTVGSDIDDKFYEGEATQPGHVTNGLVVTRPDLVTEVLAGIDDDRPVVITGPSGIGKSALLWTIPLALPGVAWFRVQRLQTAADANELLRLARAYGASNAHPVGFLIDGAGAGELTGWERLRSQAVSQAGVLLVSTARNEDLVALGPLAGTTTIAVALDEAAAAVIFKGLKRRGATHVPHWREAFEQSGGLTLEFTHLLTRGRRLHEIVSDQIRQRANETRDDELDLLSLVAVADQWSSSLDLDVVAENVSTDAFGLRRAIDRLTEEHLLVENDGVLTGLHPVRSAAISAAIHSRTSPTLGSTVARVLELVDDRQLPRFISQALRDNPGLSDVVLGCGEGVSEVRRLAAFLQGLRLADEELLIRKWIKIAGDHQIRPSAQLTVIMLVLARMDMGDITPDRIRAALDEMATEQAGSLRNRLADKIGPTVIANLLFSATPGDATELIATLLDWQQPLLPSTNTDEAPPLVEALRNAPVETIADTLATIRSQDHDLLLWVVEQLGGEEELLERVRSQLPWLLELAVLSDDDGPIGYARFLHVSDEEQGDTRKRCLSLASLLLRLLPNIARTDVEALLPGRLSIEIAGHVHGMSKLLRRHDHNTTEVAWNQARTAIAQAILGAPDTTRLATAYPIVRDLADLVHEVATRWVRSDMNPQRAIALGREATRLDETAAEMPPPLRQSSTDPVSIAKTAKSSIGCPLSHLASDFTLLFRRLGNDNNHAGHAIYIRDTILEHLRKCFEEPWRLIADGDQAIRCLNELMTDARHVHDVLMALDATGDNSTPVLRAARMGPRNSALRRAAEMARRLRGSSVEERSERLIQAVASAAPNTTVELRVDERDGFIRYAVLVNTSTLLDWADIEGGIVESLKQHRQPLEQFLILPIRNGKRIEGFGLTLINTPLPATTIGEWEPLLPESHLSLLAQDVAAATQALQLLSGLADLTDVQRAHEEVAAVADVASMRLTRAVEALKAREDDHYAQEVLVTLAELVRRVRAELEGNSATGPTFAAGLALGAIEQPTEESKLVSGMWVCAIEWEIDSKPVEQFLDW